MNNCRWYRYDYRYCSPRAFTLVEILLVVAILGFLAVISVSVLPNFKRTADLNAASEDAVSLLREAQSRTLSSDGQSQYGVYFQHDRAVFFKGAAYATGTPDNREVIFPATVELSAISLDGGGTEVLYKRLTGDTDQYGTLTFRIKRDTTKQKTVTILAAGTAIQSAVGTVSSLNLVGYWDFNESSGTVASDASGNGNDGTLINMDPASDWVSGQVGNALDFDGSDDYVEISGIALPTEDFTYIAWVNPDNNSEGAIFHAGSGGSSDEIQIEFNSGAVEVEVNNSPDILSSGVIPENVWTHIAVVRLGSDVTIYVNGAVDDTGTEGTVLDFGSCSLFIGKDAGSCTGSGDFFDGTIDEARIYARALSEQEVGLLYNAGA